MQGHRHDTNEEPAELSGGRRRYDETDFLQVEIEGVMRFTQQDRKNLQVVFTKLDQVDQVEGGNPDKKGKGEEETSSMNSDTEEQEVINQVIQDQVGGIGVRNQEKHDIVFTKLDQVVQVEGGNPDDKGKGEEETLSENSDTEEEEEINQVIQDQVGGIGIRNQEKHDIHQAKTEGTEVEGDDPDDKGEGEKETSSENSDTEEEEEINKVIQDQVWGIGVKNQEKHNILQAKTEDVVEHDNGTKQTVNYQAKTEGTSTRARPRAASRTRALASRTKTSSRPRPRASALRTTRSRTTPSRPTPGTRSRTTSARPRPRASASRTTTSYRPIPRALASRTRRSRPGSSKSTSRPRK